MSSHIDFGNKRKNINYPAKEYLTMPELRAGIDHLDCSIIDLLSIRQGFMEQAARIKQDRDLIRDERRIEEVLSKVIIHAEEVGADPDFIEKLYRQIIEWSIRYELDVFESGNSR